MWPFKSNDWISVYADRAEWTATKVCKSFGVKISEEPWEGATIYTLMYSKSRNKYKIKISGFNDNSDIITASPAYKRCLDKQIELQNKP